MRFGRGKRWSVVALFLATASLGPITATSLGAPQGRRLEIEDVRVGFDDRFKVGAWVPIRVQVRGNGAEPFTGFLEVLAGDDDGVAARTRWPLSVPAGESTRVAAYARPGSRSPDFRFRFISSDGTTVGETSLEAVRAGVNLPTALFPDDLQLLSLGRGQGVELVPKLPGITATRQGGNREVAVSRIAGTDADALPGRAMGYDGVDTILVDTNDKELMAAFATRGEALAQWVAQGGHLVVAVGTNWQAARESILGRLLPVKLEAPVRVTDLRALESYAAASAQITESNQPAQVVRLEGADDSGAKILSSTASTPLVVRGAHGFGRVTVVAFDVDAPPFSNWADRNLFWVKALDLRTGEGSIGSNRGGARLVQSGATDLSSVLRTSLDSFPGVRMVPFGWVAFLIFVYILLIGPFDYFFLKKVVKRMELTWITFPLIVATASAAAAYAAYSIKGTELRLNQIDVVDVDQTAKLTRGASLLNVFSPSNQDYDVAVKPSALGAGAAPAAPEIRLSWLGAADDGLRGMNGTARGLTFANDGYAYAPVGSVERLESVRIPIWSTKSLYARWFAPYSGEAIESDLQQVGPDRLAGTITNRLDVPLRDVIVAFGTQVYHNIPELAPGATIRIELRLDRQLSGYLKDLREFYAKGLEGGRSAAIDRNALARAILFSGSENSSTDPMSNQAFEELDMSGLLRLDRPILVALMDKPAAEVSLGTTSSPPRVVRTTLLRVVLPLDRGKAASPGAIPR